MFIRRGDSHSKTSPEVKSAQLSTNTDCFTPGPEEPKHPERMNWVLM